MSEPLKPCPWCGTNSFVRRNSLVGWADLKGFYAICEAELCPVNPSTVTCRTEEEAVALWNTRKPTDALVAALKLAIRCAFNGNGLCPVCRKEIAAALKLAGEDV
jgi:hypothetical protein